LHKLFLDILTFVDATEVKIKFIHYKKKTYLRRNNP